MESGGKATEEAWGGVMPDVIYSCHMPRFSHDVVAEAVALAGFFCLLLQATE